MESDFVFSDGTFTLTKDVEYTQVYILSILVKKENRTFSYPICFSLMKGRSAENYRELFRVLSDSFEKIEKRPLKIKRIFSDCEKAIFKPLTEIFEGIRIKLCKIHVTRAWQRKMVEIFGQINFLADETLIEFWTLLRGVFYVPPIYLNIISAFFVKEFRPKLPKKKFDEFLSYLEKNYFSPEAVFLPSRWSYYNQISDDNDIESSTNSIERLNLALKEACPQGHINFHRAVEILFDFKCKYLGQFIYRMKNDQLNLKKSQQIYNKKVIRDLVRIFSNYDAKKQQNVKSLVNHMKKCAKYTEDTFYFEDSVCSDYPSFSNSMNSEPTYTTLMHMC